MRLRHSKKAQETIYFVAIEVFLVTIVLLAFLANVNSIKNKSIYQKQFLCRDIALIANTIYSAPGNIYYMYEPYEIQGINFQRYDYNLEEYKSRVIDKTLETFYPFGKNTLLENGISLIQKPSKIELSLSGGKFAFGKGIKTNYYAKNIRKTTTSSTNIIFVSGVQKNPKTGSFYTEGQSFFSSTNLPGEIKSNFKISNVSKGTAFRLLEQYNSDLIIGIRQDNLLGEEVRIYVSSHGLNETRYMASIMVNKLQQQFPKIRQIQIIPVESSKKIVIVSAGEEFLKSYGYYIPQMFAEGVFESVP